DSGIEWLGEVPAHWNLKRIKHLILSIEQGWSPQCENFPVDSSGEWGVLKVGCVNGGKFNSAENKALPLDLKPIPTLAINKDDVLISRANTRELVGSAAIAFDNYPNLMLCDKLYRLKMIHNACLPEFLVFYLGIGLIRGQIELAATGASSSMLNIGQSTILEMDIALPSSEEQFKIISFLKEETAKLDNLTTAAQRAIELLKERRSALISAAVTGKIDVRGLVETLPESITA
ncbi:MAG: restriction endonuclease subunit S, partial [Gammaproteobacteria bacterium]